MQFRVLHFIFEAMKDEKAKRGRPKGKPTAIITFRVEKEKKDLVASRYGKKLTPMFHNWFNSITA